MNPIDKTIEKTSFSQEKLASLLGIARQTLLNYRNTPESIPAKTINKLLFLSGLSYEELFEEEPPLYTSGSLSSVCQEIKPIEDILYRKKNLINSPSFSSSLKDVALNEIETQLTFAENAKRKIVVAVVGFYSSGKSTLIQKITGKKLFLSSPTVNVDFPIFFSHIKDYSFENTNILANAEAIFSDNTKIYGDYERLLIQLGTETNDNGITKQIKQINVYLDSELLKDITLVETHTINDLVSLDTKPDLLIYVAAPFLNSTKEEQQGYYNYMMATSKDFKDIIVAINNSIFGSEEDAKQYMKDFIEDVIKRISESPFSIDTDRSKEKEVLNKRCFFLHSYNPDSNLDQNYFMNGFSNIISELYDKQKKHFIIQEYSLCDEQINSYNNKLTELTQESLDTIPNSDYPSVESVKDYIKESITNIYNEIELRKAQAKKQFEAELSNMLANIPQGKNVICNDALRNGINAEKNKQKKDSAKEILQDTIINITTKQSEHLVKVFSDDFKYFINQYNNTINHLESNFKFLEENLDVYSIIEKCKLKLATPVYDFIPMSAGAYHIIEKHGITENKKTIIDTIGGRFMLDASIATTSPIGLAAPILIPILGLTSFKQNKTKKDENKLANNVANYLKEVNYKRRFIEAIDDFYKKISKYQEYLNSISNYCDSKPYNLQIQNTGIMTSYKSMFYQSMWEMYCSIKDYLDTMLISK